MKLPSTLLTRRGFGGGALALAGTRSIPGRAAAATATPVVVASDEDVTTLDPHLIRNNHPIGSIVWSVFDSLVRRRPDGTHESRLATSWEQLDPTHWRFHLRSGVIFHNGETLEAAAVVESFERMHRSPFNGESQLWQQTGLVSVSAPGPLVVDLVTAGPSVSMLYWLEEAFIAAPRYMRETPPDHIAAHPVGSGPYRFVEWQQGDHVSLTAFDGYWGGAPPIRDIVFRTVPELASRVAELRGGSVDLVPALNPDSADSAKSAVSDVSVITGLRKMHMGLSQHGIAALRDRSVRQALNHAVDVPTMIDTLQRGMTKPLASLVNPPNSDAALKPFAFDAARASALLHSSGHEGFALEIAFDGKYPDAQETCEAVGSYLSAIGLNPTVTAYESGHFMETLRARSFPGIYFYGFAALINPVVELSIFASGAVDNASGYSNPQFDALITTASLTLDETARTKLLGQAEAMLWDDAPWLYLWQLPEITGCSRRLRYQPRPDDYIELYKASLAA